MGGTTPVAEVDDDRSPATRPPHRFKPEIQALRALAVATVVLYHLWPRHLPGGYVGVDVFFVISGYLITSHIVGSVDNSTFKLRDFYARRVRRLLPASLFVLLVSTAATVLLLPETAWNSTAKQVIASVLYVENWFLAYDAVDYLAAPADVSPVQHFWSLSVEEQFYAVWPLLILLIAVTGRGRITLRVSLIVVATASLCYSIYITQASPAWAYFVTPARAWEFAAGGLLAVTPLAVRNSALRNVLAWGGLTAIVLASLLYSGATAFPGYAAVLPVAGTVAVILAGDVSGAWSPGYIFRRPSVQFLGDISYSVYLWHWPLLVIVPVAIGGAGHKLDTAGVAMIGVSSVILGWASKTLIEDPFRQSSRLVPLTRTTPKLLTSAVLAMVIVASVATIPLTVSENRISAAEHELARHGVGDPACGEGQPPLVCDPATGSFVPDPIIAAQDVWRPECQQRGDRSSIIVCEAGRKQGLRVVVAGDSHTSQWMPALERVADELGWRVTTYFKSGCPFTSAPTLNSSCRDWNSLLKTKLAGEQVDVLIVSAASGSLYVPNRSDDMAARGFVDAWSGPIARGVTVVALADTPSPRWSNIPDVPSCVADGRSCSLDQDAALPQDPIALAVGSVGDGARLIDPSPWFCLDGQCPAIVGDVLVYRDGSHMTATYAAALTQPLTDSFKGLTGDNR